MPTDVIRQVKTVLQVFSACTSSINVFKTNCMQPQVLKQFTVLYSPPFDPHEQLRRPSCKYNAVTRSTCRLVLESVYEEQRGPQVQTSQFFTFPVS